MPCYNEKKEASMRKLKLSSGYEIDIVGSGTNTFGKEGGSYMGELTMDPKEILSAIDAGYRHFDTAVSYRNEAVVGLGVKKSGLPREAFFLTSKIPGKELYTKDETSIDRTVNESLDKLDTNYIDLYLIHHPWDDLEDMLRVWHVLEKHVDAGTIRSLGVSNFDEAQLTYILEHATHKPTVNQIESHPGKWNDALIEFCRSHNVFVEAWGPLSRVSEESKQVLSDIGARYGKSWAQVSLCYQIQRDVIVIPKSHNPLRQKANLDIFDFTLTEDEVNVIGTL